MRLLTVLLELGGDKEGKRKATQYPERTPERDHLYNWQEFLCLQNTNGNIRHATGKVKYYADGSFLYSFNLLTLILCERIVPDKDTGCMTRL